MNGSGPITTATARVSALNLFPVYSTREDYEKRTGKICPAWDPSKPEKHWEDPLYVTDGVYKQVVDGAPAPKLKRFVMEPEEAAAVNIPPDVANGGNGMPAVPIPVRDLVAGVEELFIMSPFTGPVVKNVALYNAQQEQQQMQSGGFMATDRAIANETHALAMQIAAALKATDVNIAAALKLPGTKLV